MVHGPSGRLGACVGAILFLAFGLARPAEAASGEIGLRSLRMGTAPKASTRAGMTMGATVKVDMALDNQQPYADFPRFAQPAQLVDLGTLQPYPAAAHSSFNLTAGETQLFWGWGTTRWGSWKGDGYVELSLMGYPSTGMDFSALTPSLRYAWGRARFDPWHVTLLVGQLHGPFCPLDPPILQGAMAEYAGNTGVRAPQLQFQWSIADFKAALALMRPGDPAADLPNQGLSLVGHGQDARLPALETRLSWAPGFLGNVGYGDRLVPAEIGLSGRFSQESFMPGTTAVRSISSFGVGLDFHTPVIGPIEVLGEAFWGRDLSAVYGLGSVIGDYNDDRTIFSPRTAVPEYGAWLGLRGNAAPGLSVNLVYGLDVPDRTLLASGAHDTGFDVTRNELYALNVLWNPFGTLTWGVEIARLSTGYLGPGQGGNKSDGKLDRLLVSAIQSF